MEFLIVAEIVNNILLIVKDERDPDKQLKRILICLNEKLEELNEELTKISTDISEAIINNLHDEVVTEMVIQRYIVNNIEELEKIIIKYKEVK